MCEGCDPAGHVARLHRLRGATDAYCTELGRALPVARCLYRAGDERAGHLVDSLDAALDDEVPAIGSPVQVRGVLRDLLGRPEPQP